MQTTVGYEALLRILVDILEKENNINKLNYEIAKEIFYDKYLSKIKSLDVTDVNRYSFNQRGKKYFYLDMSLQVFPPKSIDDPRLIELKNLE